MEEGAFLWSDFFSRTRGWCGFESLGLPSWSGCHGGFCNRGEGAFLGVAFLGSGAGCRLLTAWTTSLTRHDDCVMILLGDLCRLESIEPMRRS